MKHIDNLFQGISKNGHGEAPRAGRFMKIDINHPQYT